MITLKEFKDKLIEDSITIKNEQINDGINIITINQLPSSIMKVQANRREIYEYGKFVIKSPDIQKFSNKTKSNLEELKLEILAIKKFKNRIPLLEKLAIVQQNFERYFLVEELLISYDKLKDNVNLKNEASKLVESAKKIFKNGDFKIENIVYDNNTKKLLFTDVFPSEAHLINEQVI